MKINELIKELEAVQATYGNIEAQIQSNPAHDGKGIVNDEQIYVIPEQYSESGMTCNIRTWPY